MTKIAPIVRSRSLTSAKSIYGIFLLVVAGLGGLLYGVDVGIIGGALPYLEATSKLTTSQLSIIVAAVLLGSVFSTLFAGVLADLLGRKTMMVLSGAMFVASVPTIALSHSYGLLFLGRLLQGASGGVIGMVVPLYLAECLTATNRGKGTGVFQWMLTLGIVTAAFVGIYYSYRVQAISSLRDATALLAFKDQAWRRIFWVSLPPGLLFLLGSMAVTESPRWLLKGGKDAKAEAALLRSRSEAEAALEMEEMRAVANAAMETRKAGHGAKDSLLQRKYVIPFLLACAILTLNQMTGINSIIGFNTSILLQSGLSDLFAHWGYVIFTIVNFALTMVGVVLVDKKGRKFLFVVGTCGIVIAVTAAGILFSRTERLNGDSSAAIQAMVGPGQELELRFDRAMAARLAPSLGEHATLAVIYSYGDFTAATSYVRSDDPGAEPLRITRDSCVPANEVEAFFKDPFANLETARTSPLVIRRAPIGPIPSTANGWMVAFCLYLFAASYAMGPGVCVWLALSELMPTRIRSNGMSIALVINQFTATMIAAVFLPFVGKHGYSSMFFLFAGCTVVYMLITAFLFPETKNKTLEEIEAYFASR